MTTAYIVETENDIYVVETIEQVQQQIIKNNYVKIKQVYYYKSDNLLNDQTLYYPNGEVMYKGSILNGQKHGTGTINCDEVNGTYYIHDIKDELDRKLLTLNNDIYQIKRNMNKIEKILQTLYYNELIQGVDLDDVMKYGPEANPRSDGSLRCERIREQRTKVNKLFDQT